MWLLLGQSEIPSFDPAQWGPLSLAAGLVAAFTTAWLKGWLRRGSDYDQVCKERDEARAELASCRDRLLEITEKKDDEISEIRDRLEEKLTRANDVLSGVTEALKNRGP